MKRNTRPTRRVTPYVNGGACVGAFFMESNMDQFIRFMRYFVMFVAVTSFIIGYIIGSH
jgi:hypothetical protein